MMSNPTPVRRSPRKIYDPSFLSAQIDDQSEARATYKSNNPLDSSNDGTQQDGDADGNFELLAGQETNRFHPMFKNKNDALVPEDERTEEGSTTCEKVPTDNHVAVSGYGQDLNEMNSFDTSFVAAYIDNQFNENEAGEETNDGESGIPALDEEEGTPHKESLSQSTASDSSESQDWFDSPKTTTAVGIGEHLRPHFANGFVDNNVKDVCLDEEWSEVRRNFAEIDRSHLLVHEDNGFRGSKKFRVAMTIVGIMILAMTLSFMIIQLKANSVQVPSSPVLPPPPAALSSLCNGSILFQNNTNQSACEEACQAADCCSYPATLDLSCLAGNEETCMTYQNDCGNLLAPAGSQAWQNVTSTIPPAPANLDAVCSASTVVAANGIRQCSTYCQPAECCWEQGVTPCTSNEVCAAYSPCLHLGAVDTLSPNISALLHSVCSNQSLSSVGGYESCKVACQPAQCCFNSNVTNSMSGIGCPLQTMNQTWCHQYASCGAFFDAAASSISPSSSSGSTQHHD